MCALGTVLLMRSVPVPCPQENHHCNLAFKLIGSSGILSLMEVQDKRVRTRPQRFHTHLAPRVLLWSSNEKRTPLCTRIDAPRQASNSRDPSSPLRLFLQTLRNILVEAILHTDLALHKTMVEAVKARLTDGGGRPLRGADLSMEDRMLLVRRADTGNPSPPMQRAPWGKHHGSSC